MKAVVKTKNKGKKIEKLVMKKKVKRIEKPKLLRKLLGYNNFKSDVESF